MTEINVNLLGIFISCIGAIIFIGSFYGTTRKRLNVIEYELKKQTEYRNEIIDKLARIETKLDFLTKQK
jgi:hypothetical protein